MLVERILQLGLVGMAGIQNMLPEEERPKMVH